MSPSRLFLLVAVVLFVLAGIGFAPVRLGSVELSLVDFGLAFFAGSFLV